MGNYAYFRGCASREAAGRVVAVDAPATAVQVEAKYRIPLFWLAGFSPEDLVVVRPADDDPEAKATYEWVVPCARVHDYVTRARARRALVLSVVPKALGDCYDEWLRFVERRFAPFVMIETSDILSMADMDEGNLRLRGALRAWLEAGGRTRLADTAALDWFAQFADRFEYRTTSATADDAVREWRSLLSGDAWIAHEGDSHHIWPTSPTAAEVSWAATLAETPAAGTPEAEEAKLAATIRAGVHPEGLRGRLRLVVDQFTGDLPPGVDAPSRGARKWIAGSHAMLDVFRNGLLGFILTVLGLLFTWAGAFVRPVYWTAVGIGVGCLLAGGLLVRSAWRGRRRVRAIMRA